MILASIAPQVLATHQKHDNDRCEPKHKKIILLANLKGANEVPPVKTRATGHTIFLLSSDGKTLFYLLYVSKIENVTVAHIHLGRRGENGPVVVFLYGPADPKPKFSGVLAVGAITKDDLIGSLAGMSMRDLLIEIKKGNAYVNVHTTQNPAGEIRGQIYKMK